MKLGSGLVLPEVFVLFDSKSDNRDRAVESGLGLGSGFEPRFSTKGQVVADRFMIDL